MNQNKLKELRKKYPKGTKIKCIKMHDPFHPIPSGMMGNVIYVDDIGTIHMAWDNGSSLGLIPDEDNFEIVVEDIQVGNMIVCNGQKIKVSKILTQESYVFLGQEIHDIEFHDEKGKYRHWKSNIDGGYIIRD